MSAEIHIGDKGTILRGTIVDENGAVVDISSATTLEMLLKPPVDAKMTKTAVFNTDGKDGKIKYVSLSTDFDEEGEWKVQARVVFVDGQVNSSIIRKFTVKGNL